MKHSPIEILFLLGQDRRTLESENQMRTLLYVIWFAVPVVFLLIALWSKLEEWSGKAKKENPGDFFKQGCFVLICAFACVLIDQYVLGGMNEEELPFGIPMLFIQIILFPIVLYAAALLIGPTKTIRIEKASRPSEKVRRK